MMHLVVVMARCCAWFLCTAEFEVEIHSKWAHISCCNGICWNPKGAVSTYTPIIRLLKRTYMTPIIDLHPLRQMISPRTMRPHTAPNARNTPDTIVSAFG